MGLVVFAGSGNGFVDDVEDVETSVAGLHEGLFEDFVAKAVALDVHLCGGDTVFGTGNLEVHIAQVVFIAQDVAEDGILAAVAYQTHGYTCNRLLHLHTCIEQGKSAGTYCGH